MHPTEPCHSPAPPAARSASPRSATGGDGAATEFRFLKSIFAELCGTRTPRDQAASPHTRVPPSATE